jgi:Mn2+/Fe2+ NRAMP family transporter
MKSLFSRISFIGPGILFAAVSIGASHIVLAPRAGMIFGFDLLWVVLVAHLFKYPAFEFGPRYAVATGRSLLAGFKAIPGRGWALWVFLVGTMLQGVGVAVAVTSITASVLEVYLGRLGVAGWGMIVITAVLAMLFAGGYRWLDRINKAMMVLLLGVTATAFLLRPPPIEAMAHLVLPALPAGSVVLVSAILGWMPTGVDVSVWQSLWVLEHGKSWGCRPDRSTSPGERAGLMSKCLLDMRVGYGLSIFLGIMFYSLGTRVSFDAASAPDGARVALSITDAYRVALGDWILPLLLLAVFFGMFSTTYVVLDGFPRAFSESLKVMAGGRRPADSPLWNRIYRLSLLVVWASVCLILFLIPRPVFLTTSAAVLSFLLAPLIFAFNYYCVTRQIEDEKLRPSRPGRWLALAGIAFMTLSSILFIAFCVG